MPGSRYAGSILCGVLSAMLPAAPPAQAAEPVAYADLAGLVVDADIHRTQDVRREGRSFSVQAQQNWKIVIAADKTIEVTVNTTMHGPQGPRKAPQNSGRFTLDESREIQNRGGGQGAWSFADGTLSFTRTFPSGAYRAHFEFARGEAGITCQVTEAFAREDNAKEITLESPFGGRVSIIRSKQESSTCQAKSP